ncbi:uncharacterized protein LOC129679581 [Psammomys obesus]|uniref:uncharacterized protein LOC129679581 n=1 Tax=Psammomys obesus TaxID=48139 RepID=UPI00245363DB|nr:uncharacterized protein LOC129679581 [Psammomys obesus]
MSGRQVSRSNTYNRSSQPSNSSFPPRTPGWTQQSSANKGLLTSIPSSSELSTSSDQTGQSEQSLNPDSPRLPVGRICMGRPYNSRCVETSHLVRGPKVVKKPTYRSSSPHCLLCMDRPSCPSSPTFLDQLIRGISYLDRSTNVFGNSSYPKSLSLPQLAATYLERAANSLYLEPEPAPPRSYSTPNTNTTTATSYPTNSSLVPSSAPAAADSLQCLYGCAGLSSPQRPHNQSFSAEMPQRSGVKLPEISLFGNGFLSLGRLPKFWEAIRTEWNTPEPTSKPSGWW